MTVPLIAPPGCIAALMLDVVEPATTPTAVAPDAEVASLYHWGNRLEVLPHPLTENSTM